MTSKKVAGFFMNSFCFSRATAILSCSHLMLHIIVDTDLHCLSKKFQIYTYVYL